MKNNKQKSIIAITLLLSLGFVAKTVTQGKLGLHYAKEKAGDDLFDRTDGAKGFKAGQRTGEAVLKDGSGNPPGFAKGDHTDGTLLHESGEGDAFGRIGNRSASVSADSVSGKLGSASLGSDSISGSSLSAKSSGAYGIKSSETGANAKLGELGTMKDGIAVAKNSSEKISAADGVMGKTKSVAANGATDAMGKTGTPGTASAESLKDGAKVGSQDFASAGKNGLLRDGVAGEKGQENFPGEKTPPQNVAVSDIRGSVFGPLGLEGESKPVTNVPGFTKLWEPQNHNPVPGKGKQTQIYQTMAAGQSWNQSSQAMKVAVNAEFQYANWLETQAHRFGMTPVNEAKDPIGGRVEVATLNPYDRARYDAGQAPDEAKFSAGSETGFKLVQCAIHPEIAFVMEIVANDLLHRPGNLGPSTGGAHQDAKMELKKLNPFSGLASIMSSIPKLVFAKASK